MDEHYKIYYTGHINKGLNMDKNLIAISNEYISEVTKICLLMLKSFNLTSKEDMIKYRVNKPIGNFYLNGENRYQFHGRGCKFSNNEINIDWDFGFDDHWCGLNPWLLADYINTTNKSIIENCTGDKIKVEFEEAIKNGEMMKKYDLYYFI